VTVKVDSGEVIRNVERYLAQQYAKREVTQHPADGVVVILAWCVVVWIWMGK